MEITKSDWERPNEEVQKDWVPTRSIRELGQREANLRTGARRWFSGAFFFRVAIWVPAFLFLTVPHSLVTIGFCLRGVCSHNLPYLFYVN